MDGWMHWWHTDLCLVSSGQERFISMTRIYYKGALGCVVMFDVTSSSSFSSCRHWKEDLDNKAMLPNGDSIPCILVANKVIECIQLMKDPPGSFEVQANEHRLLTCSESPDYKLSLSASVCLQCDLAHRAVSADTIDKFSKAHGFITWMETSVKDNKNVGEATR